MNTAWLKAHWVYVAGGVIGVLVLYEIVKHAGGGSSGAVDVSGGGAQQQNLVAAADLQNAQTNAVITQAAYAASVADNQTTAQLEAVKVQTAAQLAATLAETEAAKEVKIYGIHSGVEMQSIVSSEKLAETQIASATVEQLAKTSASVQLAQVQTVGKQVDNIMTYSKHASQDYASFAPILALETGQGGAAAAIGTANAQSKASQTASTWGGIASLGNTFLKGLFGAGA